MVHRQARNEIQRRAGNAIRCLARNLEHTRARIRIFGISSDHPDRPKLCKDFRSKCLRHRYKVGTRNDYDP